MPDPIDWTTTRDAVVSALAASSLLSDSPGRALSAAAIARLNAMGAVYDADYARLATSIAADDTEYAVLLAAWVASLPAVWNRAIAVCRYVERLTYDAQVAVVLSPRLATNTLGQRVVLAEDELALPDPFADPEPPTRASLTLLTAGAVPVLVVRALADGLAGGLVSVVVGNPTDGVATHCKITLTRGSGGTAYAEVYDNLDCTSEAGARGSQDASLLVSGFELVGLGRPANLGATVLAGGTGRLRDGLLERLGDARALPGNPALLVALVDQTVAQVERVWSEKPVLRNRIAQRESELQAALGVAEDALGYLTSGLV